MHQNSTHKNLRTVLLESVLEAVGKEPQVVGINMANEHFIRAAGNTHTGRTMVICNKDQNSSERIKKATYLARSPRSQAVSVAIAVFRCFPSPNMSPSLPRQSFVQKLPRFQNLFSKRAAPSLHGIQRVDVGHSISEALMLCQLTAPKSALQAPFLEIQSLRLFLSAFSAVQELG